MTQPSSPGLGGFVTPILLLPALLLGGGSTLGVQMDGWLSASAIVPITALVAAHAMNLRPIHRSAWPLLALVGGVLLLGRLQLHWTGEGLWWDDASRANARAGLELAGIAVDGPWSLTPDDTEMFLMRWLYPTAVLLAIAGACEKERHRTLAMVSILAVIAALLTMVQQVAPSLIPYQSDTGGGVGWFANPNHHGLFLACGIAAALLALPATVRTSRRRATGLELSRPLVLAAGSVLVVGMAVMLTGSRAALPLFLIAVALALLSRPQHAVRPTWFTWALVAFPIVAALALLLPRYLDVAFAGPSLADDKRWAALPTIVDGLVQAMPWGTGFGSFDRAYLGLEPLELLSERALNEAHNEYAQWLLEGGLGGLVLMIGLAALLATRGVNRLRNQETEASRPIRAGAIMVGLIAIHSAIDYPARTVAMGSLAMAALGLWLISPSTASRKQTPLGLALVGAVAVTAALVAPVLAAPFEKRSNPDTAYPDARGLAELAKGMAIEPGDDGYQAYATALDALERAPLEAGAYEALALVTQDDAESNAFIDAGLALSKRSGILPSLKFQRLLAEAQFDEAVEQALTLLRRGEPDASFLRSVRLAALDEGFASKLGQELDANGHWTSPLFALESEAMPLEVAGARQLLLHLAPMEGGPPPHLVEPTLARLNEAGRYSEASLLYRRLYPDRAPLSPKGYENARARSENTRFDWRFASPEGLDVGLRGSRIEMAGRGRTDGPIAWRYLALPEGSYRLTFNMTGSDESDAIIPEVLCAGGLVLAEARKVERRGRIFEFTVDEACPLVLIRLRAVPVARPYRIALDQWRLKRFPAR